MIRKRTILVECSALLVPAPGAGVWCCWYVQAENTLQRDTHGKSFFWEGWHISRSDMSRSNTAMLHFQLLTRQWKRELVACKQKSAIEFLHPASKPPMSCSLNFLPYMVKEKSCRQKGRREKKTFPEGLWAEVEEGVVYSVSDGVNVFFFFFPEPCHYTELHPPNPPALHGVRQCCMLQHGWKGHGIVGVIKSEHECNMLFNSWQVHLMWFVAALWFTHMLVQIIHQRLRQQKKKNSITLARQGLRQLRL